MKITFDNNSTNQNVDKVMTTAHRDTRTEKTNQAGAYALDISGTVMDNTAYKGQGKTAEEVMQDAEQTDVATQRDYMTVMSNTMSAEDYNRMLEDGYDIGDMDVEEVVTIVDKIKAELLKGGTQVIGYTDQIDADTLREITGSEAFARELVKEFDRHDVPLTEENVRNAKKAYDKAAELKEITEGAAKYMVENHMEPTIDNLYRAGYSSTADGDRQGRGYYADGAGYYARKAEEFNWQQLRPQMERVLEEAGLEVNEETLEDARWLVEKGIPLTPEAVTGLYRLDNLVFPQDEGHILSAIAAAIADGKSAGEANLADGRSNLDKAAEYAERFSQVPDEAVDQVIADNKELTLANLEKAAADNNMPARVPKSSMPADIAADNASLEAAGSRMPVDITADSASSEAARSNMPADIAADSASSEAARSNMPADITVDSVSSEAAGRHMPADIAADNISAEASANITARRQLEEIRLMMTVEVNRKLLESGYAIDTTELEKLVDTLKQIEERQRALLFGEADIDRASEKAALYAETRHKVSEIPYLPIDIAGRFRVTDEDFTLNQVHISGTALRNHYDEARERYETWMTEAREELGDSMEKAFRNVDAILADLGLENSEENRRAVRILGYNRMELSRENIETVRASDTELQQVVDKMTPAAVLQTIRDGKNPLEMTLPELNAYLDSLQGGREQDIEKFSKFLYKLDRNKAITGEERTAYIGIYRMLRQFEKTDNAGIGALINIGAEVSFKNMLSAVRSRKRAGMDFMVDDAFAGVEAIEKGMSITKQIETGFPKYYRDIVGDIADRMARQDADTQKEYRAEQMQDCRQACEAEDAVIEELLYNRQPVTVNNLAAADMLMNSRGAVYKKLGEYTAPEDKGKVREAVSRLQEALTDKDSAQEAYGEMQQVFEEALDHARYSADLSYIDLKMMQNCYKQLTLAGNLAKEENYQIPVEINGETTAIHLRVLHNQKDGGRVKITFETESHGRVAAQFGIRGGRLNGYIACSTPEGTEVVQSKVGNLQESLRDLFTLKQEGPEIGDIGVVHSSELDLNFFTSEAMQEETSAAQTVDLYQTAKVFISVITE